MSEVAYKTWEEMSTLEQYACTFWDMYKDAHGFRPRHIDTNSWTEAQFEAEFKELADVIEREEIQRREDEAQAVVRFEARVQSIMAMGAKDRAMALRWIHEAEGSDGDDEFLCYLVGVPYGYFKIAV
jgi:hypothetical protein